MSSRSEYICEPLGPALAFDVPNRATLDVQAALTR